VRVLDGEPWFEQCVKHGQALVAGLTSPRQFAVRAVGGAYRTMRALTASRRWTWLKRSLVTQVTPEQVLPNSQTGGEGCWMHAEPIGVLNRSYGRFKGPLPC
jgi:hypothetical protein